MKRGHVQAAPLFAPSGARLDEIDLALLRLLKADARQENQALAVKVGLSPSAVSYRVRRLEETGVIRGYIAIAEESVFASWSVFWINVRLRRRANPERTQFETALRDCAEVMEAHEVAGRFDYILKVALPSAAQWAELRARLDPDNRFIKSVDFFAGLRTAKGISPHPILLSGEPTQRL